MGGVGAVDDRGLQAVDEHPPPAALGVDNADGWATPPAVTPAFAALGHGYAAAASGALRSRAPQPTSAARISSSASAPPRRPKSRLA